MRIQSRLFHSILTLILFQSALIIHAQTVENSVVTIYCEKPSGSSQGTGFVLGTQGLIVTAYHVVEDARKITVRNAAYTALNNVMVEYIDAGHDIAILKSDESQNIPGLKTADGNPLPHQNIYVAGSPRGLPKQELFGRITSDGSVSSLKMSTAGGGQLFAKDIDIYPIDVTIYDGMSGAPVLGTNNSVIGLLSGSYDQGRGIGWAIPLKYVLDLLKQTKIDKAAQSMGVWPALSLMGPRWQRNTRCRLQVVDRGRESACTDTVFQIKDRAARILERRN